MTTGTAGRPVPVLLYHRVTNDPDPFGSTPELFESHLRWLADAGYHTISGRELTERLQTGRCGDGREVVITFDDGYRELGTTVADALRRHGFTATAFLITGRNPTTATEGVAGDADPGASAEYLAWDRARELADEGLFEFHSHTHSHDRWPLEPDQASVLADEVTLARRTLGRHLGRDESSFDQLAWPWGRACQAWEDAAIESGATTHYVVQRGAVTRPGQTVRLPRLLVDGMGLAQFRLWLTVLSSRPGAMAVNRVFGTVRARRRGAAYV